MIIGTSDNMVKKLQRHWGFKNQIDIFALKTWQHLKEIEKAQYARLKEGKHIIPVPTMELKPHFKGYLIDPIKTIWRRRTLSKQDPDKIGQIGSEGFERSVVRPALSAIMDDSPFDDDVIIKLIRNGLKSCPGVDDSQTLLSKRALKGKMV